MEQDDRYQAEERRGRGQLQSITANIVDIYFKNLYFFHLVSQDRPTRRTECKPKPERRFVVEILHAAQLTRGKNKTGDSCCTSRAMKRT